MRSSNQGILGSVAAGDVKLELKYSLVESISTEAGDADELASAGGRGEAGLLRFAFALNWN